MLILFIGMKFLLEISFITVCAFKIIFAIKCFLTEEGGDMTQSPSPLWYLTVE